MALKHEELTRLIIECIFEVHNDVGVGLDEATYHQSLLDCFFDKGVPGISKERKHLVHRRPNFVWSDCYSKPDYRIRRCAYENILATFKHTNRVAGKLWQIKS